MRIFMTAVAFCGALLLGDQQSKAGTLFLSDLSNVKAIRGSEEFQADASHGFLSGNNLAAPTLLTLLNNPDGNPIEMDMWDGPPANGSAVSVFISEDGMFGSTLTFRTNSNGSLDLTTGQTVDSLQGVKINTTRDWSLIGTTNFKENGTAHPGGPFSSSVLTPDAANGTLGTLDLDSGVSLSGTYVLALKANGAYAVYAFQNLAGVTSFTYNHGDSGLTSDLSHASLYYSGPNTSVAPEPSSWAIFGLVGLGMAWSVARRRNQVAQHLE